MSITSAASSSSTSSENNNNSSNNKPTRLDPRLRPTCVNVIYSPHPAHRLVAAVATIEMKFLENHDPALQRLSHEPRQEVVFSQEPISKIELHALNIEINHARFLLHNNNNNKSASQKKMCDFSHSSSSSSSSSQQQQNQQQRQQYKVDPDSETVTFFLPDPSFYLHPGDACQLTLHFVTQIQCAKQSKPSFGKERLRSEGIFFSEDFDNFETDIWTPLSVLSSSSSSSPVCFDPSCRGCSSSSSSSSLTSNSNNNQQNNTNNSLTNSQDGASQERQEVEKQKEEEQEDPKQRTLERCLWTLCTQHEPCNARRTCVCFDEPIFRCVWNVSIVTPSNIVAFSNSLQCESNNNNQKENSSSSLPGFHEFMTSQRAQRAFSSFQPKNETVIDSISNSISASCFSSSSQSTTTTTTTTTTKIFSQQEEQEPEEQRARAAAAHHLTCLCRFPAPGYKQDNATAHTTPASINLSSSSYFSRQSCQCVSVGKFCQHRVVHSFSSAAPIPPHILAIYTSRRKDVEILRDVIPARSVSTYTDFSPFRSVQDQQIHSLFGHNNNNNNKQSNNNNQNSSSCTSFQDASSSNSSSSVTQPFSKLYQVQVPPTPVSIIVPTELPSAEMGRYSLNMMKDAILFFERILKYPFPYTCLQMASSKSFTSLGMENAALILMMHESATESYVFVDEELTPIERVQRIERLVFHEVSHMWFGDCTTVEFWHLTGVLKENCARYFEFLGCESHRRKWRMIDTFNPSITIQALDDDLDSFEQDERNGFHDQSNNNNNNNNNKKQQQRQQRSIEIPPSTPPRKMMNFFDSRTYGLAGTFLNAIHSCLMTLPLNQQQKQQQEAQSQEGGENVLAFEKDLFCDGMARLINHYCATHASLTEFASCIEEAFAAANGGKQLRFSILQSNNNQKQQQQQQDSSSSSNPIYSTPTTSLSVLELYDKWVAQVGHSVVCIHSLKSCGCCTISPDAGCRKNATPPSQSHVPFYIPVVVPSSSSSSFYSSSSSNVEILLWNAHHDSIDSVCSLHQNLLQQEEGTGARRPKVSRVIATAPIRFLTDSSSSFSSSSSSSSSQDYVFGLLNLNRQWQGQDYDSPSLFQRSPIFHTLALNTPLSLSKLKSSAKQALSLLDDDDDDENEEDNNKKEENNNNNQQEDSSSNSSSGKKQNKQGKQDKIDQFFEQKIYSSLADQKRFEAFGLSTLTTWKNMLKQHLLLLLLLPVNSSQNQQQIQNTNNSNNNQQELKERLKSTLDRPSLESLREQIRCLRDFISLEGEEGEISQNQNNNNNLDGKILRNELLQIAKTVFACKAKLQQQEEQNKEEQDGANSAVSSSSSSSASSSSTWKHFHPYETWDARFHLSAPVHGLFVELLSEAEPANSPMNKEMRKIVIDFVLSGTSDKKNNNSNMEKKESSISSTTGASAGGSQEDHASQEQDGEEEQKKPFRSISIPLKCQQFHLKTFLRELYEAIKTQFVTSTPQLAELVNLHQQQQRQQQMIQQEEGKPVDKSDEEEDSEVPALLLPPEIEMEIPEIASQFLHGRLKELLANVDDNNEEEAEEENENETNKEKKKRKKKKKKKKVDLSTSTNFAKLIIEIAVCRNLYPPASDNKKKKNTEKQQQEEEQVKNEGESKHEDEEEEEEEETNNNNHESTAELCTKQFQLYLKTLVSPICSMLGGTGAGTTRLIELTKKNSDFRFFAEFISKSPYVVRVMEFCLKYAIKDAGANITELVATKIRFELKNKKSQQQQQQAKKSLEELISNFKKGANQDMEDEKEKEEERKRTMEMQIAKRLKESFLAWRHQFVST